MTRRELEHAAGARLSRGWVCVDGGEKRFGWSRVSVRDDGRKLAYEYLGRTLDDAARALGVEVQS